MKTIRKISPTLTSYGALSSLFLPKACRSYFSAPCCRDPEQTYLENGMHNQKYIWAHQGGQKHDFHLR